MFWRKMVFVVGAVALSLAGCVDQPSSPAADDAEREFLVQRALALKASVAATGRISEEQRRELSDLTRKVTEWQARTGRTDLSVSTSRPGPALGTAALVSRGPTESCSPCPGVTADGGYICFLAEEGPCGEPGNIIQRVCAYACIYVGPPRSR